MNQELTNESTTGTTENSVYMAALKATTLCDYLLPIIDTLLENKVLRMQDKKAAIDFRRAAYNLCNKVFSSESSEGEGIKEEYNELMFHIKGELNSIYSEFGIE